MQQQNIIVIDDAKQDKYKIKETIQKVCSFCNKNHAVYIVVINPIQHSCDPCYMKSQIQQEKFIKYLDVSQLILSSIKKYNELKLQANVSFVKNQTKQIFFESIEQSKSKISYFNQLSLQIKNKMTIQLNSLEQKCNFKPFEQMAQKICNCQLLAIENINNLMQISKINQKPTSKQDILIFKTISSNQQQKKLKKFFQFVEKNCSQFKNKCINAINDSIIQFDSYL